MAFELTEEQRKTMLAFLNDAKRDELIEAWLKDAGLSHLKAKLVTKLVLPAIGKLIGGMALRGAERLNESLRQHWSQYDKFIDWAERWLLIQVETTYKGKELLEARLEPVGQIDPDQWKDLNEQTRVWIAQLEQLNFIALSLGKLDADISLRIDEPRPLDAKQPSRLLRAYNAFVPLTGRDLELRNLRKFCEKNVTFAWQVVVGEGGTGKTRLSLELVKEYARAGWVAGFISEESLNHFVTHDGFKRWVPLTDTLIVIDYAATKVETLKQLLSRCAELAIQPSHVQDDFRLRIMLLERHAYRDQGWLSEILGFAEGRLRDEIDDALEVWELHAPGHEDPQRTMAEILYATMKSWERLTQEKAPLQASGKRPLRRQDAQLRFASALPVRALTPLNPIWRGALGC